MPLFVQAMIAGVLFGLWPLLYRGNGLTGNAVSLVFFGVQLAFLILYASVTGFGGGATAHWKPILLGTLASLGGVLLFNDLLMRSTPTSLGALFVIMIACQVSVPALYSVIVSGVLDVRTALGFVLVGTGATLLVSRI